jgi:DNA-binding GntR family transcriptional regulator
MALRTTTVTTQRKTTKYFEVQENLRYRILGGEWKPGEKFLTETELCKVFNVSRITIRKAIMQLASEGLLIRQSGKGTFIREFEDVQNESSPVLKSFTNEMREMGKYAISLDVDLQVVSASRALASLLSINQGDQIIQLRRLRAINENEIIAYSINSFPFTRQFSTDPKEYYQSFYEYLQKFGIFFSTASEYLEATIPPKDIAEKLQIDVREPVLKSVKVSHTSDMSFSEHNLCYYIGSKYRYYVNY